MSVKPSKGTKGASSKAKSTIANVPGPSSNPATNLLIWNIAARGLTIIVGRQIEKALFQLRHRHDEAGDEVENRSKVKSLTATSAARFASKSLPGFVAVTGVLLAKTALDRGFGHRKAQPQGEKQIAEQAGDASE